MIPKGSPGKNLFFEERFFSKVLGVETYFLIVVPDQAREPLPGLILLRGRPEEWLNGYEDKTRSGRTIITVLDDLLEKGYCSPMAFILPRTTNQSMTGFISHGKAQRPDLLTDNSYIGNGNIDDFIDLELLPRCYSSGLVRENRVSIDGFSLGGASAVYHALRRPDLFKSCGSFDGAFLKYEFDNPVIFPTTPSDLRFDHFPYLFGFPPDETAFRRQNPLDLVSEAEMPPAMIHYSASGTPTANGWRVRALLDQGIKNYASAPLIDPNSDHSWWWVDEHLYHTLPFHSRLLNNP
jgi:hypothetical protein